MKHKTFKERLIELVFFVLAVACIASIDWLVGEGSFVIRFGKAALLLLAFWGTLFVLFDLIPGDDRDRRIVWPSIRNGLLGGFVVAVIGFHFQAFDWWYLLVLPVLGLGRAGTGLLQRRRS